MPYIMVYNDSESPTYINTEYISFIRRDEEDVEVGLAGGPGSLEIPNATIKEVMGWINDANQAS